MDFFPDKTIVVMFDTEWYVPRDARSLYISSLKSNPMVPNNQFLGGVFYRFYPLKDKGQKFEKKEIFVSSLAPDEEKEKLSETYNYFKQSWDLLRGKMDRDADLITVGIGNSRFDLPSLFARSIFLGVDRPEMLYEVFLKTKPIDLSESTIPYFTWKGKRVLYPIVTNSMIKGFELNSQKKESGKRVWEMVEANDFESIKARVRGEVSDIWEIYNKLMKDIFRN